MRNQFTISTKLSANSNNGGEHGDQSWSETDDTRTAGSSPRFKIPASQTDYEIDLTDMMTVGAFLALRSDQDISVKLNDAANTAIAVKKITAERYGYLAVSADVTKLFVTTGDSETFVDVAYSGT